MALVIDTNVLGTQITGSGTVTTPSFTTAGASELLVAFVACDASHVNTMTGGGLTWVQRKISNANLSGSCEIWTAFAPTVLTNQTVTVTSSAGTDSVYANVISFIGADSSGASGSGAVGATANPTAASGVVTGTVTTTRPNSWVMGQVIYGSNTLGPTIGSNQTLINDLNDSRNTDRIWTQRQTNATPAAGTVVTINDTAPSGAAWNMCIIEILAAHNYGFITNTVRPRSFSPGLAR